MRFWKEGSEEGDGRRVKKERMEEEREEDGERVRKGEIMEKGEGVRYMYT